MLLLAQEKTENITFSSDENRGILEKSQGMLAKYYTACQAH